VGHEPNGYACVRGNFSIQKTGGGKKNDHDGWASPRNVESDVDLKKAFKRETGKTTNKKD